jgi:hypothetical protein
MCFLIGEELSINDKISFFPQSLRYNIKFKDGNKFQVFLKNLQRAEVLFPVICCLVIIFGLFFFLMRSLKLLTQIMSLVAFLLFCF